MQLLHQVPRWIHVTFWLGMSLPGLCLLVWSIMMPSTSWIDLMDLDDPRGKLSAAIIGSSSVALCGFATLLAPSRNSSKAIDVLIVLLFWSFCQFSFCVFLQGILPLLNLLKLESGEVWRMKTFI